MPALVLAVAWAFRKGRGTAREPLFWLGFLPGMAAYAFILRSTLLGFSATFMYLTWPALCGCFAMSACRQENPEQGKLPQGQCVLAALLVFLLVCRFWCVLVTGWKSANVATANLKQITAGPAAGTWADEKAADMQMALYEALELCGQAGAAGYWRAARPWLYDGGRNLDHRSGVRHLRYRQRPAVHPVL